VQRRTLLITGTSLVMLASVPKPLRAAATAASQQPAPFDPGLPRKMAQELAQKSFQPPDNKLPDPLAHLNYDQYRDIRFDPQRALWRDQGLLFTLQLFHRGFLYTNRVDLYEVVDGAAQPIHYNADLFNFGANQRPPDEDIGFAGFRIHTPINRPDYYDEVAAFLGASYFRAVGKGQGYGLSARGLAINTADPSGEEFPVFKTFWIERPRPGVNSIVVNALLDSKSTAGALRCTIRPGDTTIFDVETTFYPRADIADPGIAPLTSMFEFDANNRYEVDDYRPAVHDSDGLSIWTGQGEQIWRPLNNPHDLQLSTFSDTNPRGFGLMQRKRNFSAYDDLEAHYELRPSLWVEPIGDWGEGAVRLIEIPTGEEIHDNVVAFWRPAQPLKAKGEYNFTYRLHWTAAAPPGAGTAQFVDTRSGSAGAKNKNRLFVLEAAGDKLKQLPADAKPQLETNADHGQIVNPVLAPNPEAGGWRASFELAPGSEKVVELRARIKQGDMPLTETWTYRWTP
jgi:periplasmic glucans biosynthesis protein